MKIFLVSLISTAVLAISGGVVLYYVSAENLKREVANNLVTVAKNKATWIKSYLAEREKNLKTLALTEDVRVSFEKIMVYYKKERFYDLKQKRYKEIYSEMDPFFRGYLEIYGYHDIFFIGAAYGHVMYSAKRETPLGTNLGTGPFKDSPLAKLWKKTVKDKKVSFVDFEYYSPSKEPAMFIGSPAFGQSGNVSAVVALQIGIKEINEVMKDRSGLGMTGDTYLVGEDFLMRSDSRFSKKSTILKQKVDTENVKQCFLQSGSRQGESGKALIFKNYRGVNVLGTYVYIPEMKWALLAEISEKEALAPLHELSRFFILVGLIVIFVIYVVSNWLGRKFSIPIETLQRGTEIITGGNLDYKVSLKSGDEIGRLSRAFDDMTCKLKESYEGLEGKVRRRTEELEAVNKELDSFVYTASHDLRAPLRGISSFASFLEEDYGGRLDEKGKDCLLEIRNGANQLSCLIDDLLALSRITRIRNPYEDVRINDLIEIILKRMEFDIREKGVTIKAQQNIPLIYCDRIKLGEVFFNLINNAIKFSSKNNKTGPEIEIGYDDRDECYEFYVKDNGIGIDPQYHERVFGIFKRLHRQGEYDGTGAGLSIVKRVIDSHGGRIWIESELGAGATFYFSIPKNLKERKKRDDGLS